ncbi:MAG: hypothetical protein ACE5IY_10235 [bacterium]
MENVPPDPSWEDKAGEPNPQRGFPIAEVVSLETVVNILIRKGICTPDELYEEEQKRRKEMLSTRPTPVVHTGRQAHSHGNGTNHRRTSSWLKRKMSKRRWTRRLGTRIFGWEWKKVKTNKGDHPFENPQL